MAFQINPNIPLQALVNPVNFADSLTKAQNYEANALKLQALRDEYNAAKEERDRQKAIRKGVASELEKMQQGTLAQYRTTFPQTMPTGQMSSGMTGVLASERGQNLPQPALFGENILQGNFDINRELVSPAIAPKKPDIKDILTAQLNAAVANNDAATAFDASKKLKELEKNLIKWGMNPQKGINPATGLPDTFVTNESGELKFLNVSPYEEPKTPKTSLITTSLGYEVVEEGKLPKGKPVVPTKEPKAPQLEKITGRDGSVNIVNMATGEIKPVLADGKPFIAKDDPLTLFTQKEEFKSELKQRETVAQKYADAESIEPILKQLISQLEKVPKTGIGRDIQGGLEYFGAGNEAAQNAMAEVKNTEALLVPFAQKQTGPQSDKDVQQYKEQVAAASNPLASASSRIAAAKNALMFAERVKKRYGNYASDILSGKVTPDELKTEPSKPTRSKDELFRLYKEFKADYEAEKDPAMRKLMIEEARKDGLIK